MPILQIVRGQKVSPEMLERARELRRQMTPAEALLWSQLRGQGLQGFHFRRQQVIGPYIADFYCHAAGVVIELDGEIHQFQQAEDHEREQNLVSHGLRVIRFTNQQVQDELDWVTAEIVRACKENSLTYSGNAGSP